MYYFFSVLLIFVFLILTVGAETAKGKNHPRVFFNINLVLTVIGVVLFSSVSVYAWCAVHNSGFDAEFAEWAWDMFVVYYQLSLIPLAVFVFLSAMSCLIAVFEPKQRNGFSLKLRLSVTIVFSVVILFIAPMYSFMTVNEKVAVDTFVLLTGIGEALLLRAPLLIEYGYRIGEKKKDKHQ